MDDAGQLETWEYQGGTFTNVSSWAEVGAKLLSELNIGKCIDANAVTNLFSVRRGYIYRETGNLGTANTDNYIRTDYIPVAFLKDVVISGITDNTSSACIGFFDINRNALGTHLFDTIGSHDITITDEIISGFPDAKYIVLADTNYGNNVSFVTSNAELYKSIKSLTSDVESLISDVESLISDVESLNSDVESLNNRLNGTSNVDIYNQYPLFASSFTNSVYHFLQAIGNVDEKVLSKIKIHVGTISDSLTIGLATINTDVPTADSDIDIYWSTQIEIEGEEQQKDVELSIHSLPICKTNSYLYVHREESGNTASLALYESTGSILYRYNSITTGYGYTTVSDKQMMIELTFGIEGIEKTLEKLNTDVESLNYDVEELKIKNGKAIDAITYVVDKSGRGDFTKIQDAIDVSQDGDIIYVMPGEYEECLDMKTKVISLIGQNPRNTIVYSCVGTYAEPPLVCCHGLLEGIQFYAKRDPE